MAVSKENTYVVGSNNDLSNALLNIDLNRIGGDLTFLELDGSTVKVSVGSLIEANGSLYAVETAAETPSGSAAAGAYLFFDSSTEAFVWSSSAGTYDATKGGRYDGSGRRQCRWRLTAATTYELLLGTTYSTVRFDGDVDVDGDLSVGDDLSVGGDISASGAITGASINTGGGDFEIGQDLRTTDDTTFNTVTATSRFEGPRGGILALQITGVDLLSQNWIYGRLSPYIPTGEIVLTGGGNVAGTAVILAYAKRTGVSTITLYGNTVGGVAWSQACVDGNMSNVFGGGTTIFA